MGTGLGSETWADAEVGWGKGEDQWWGRGTGSRQGGSRRGLGVSTVKRAGSRVGVVAGTM